MELGDAHQAYPSSSIRTTLEGALLGARDGAARPSRYAPLVEVTGDDAGPRH
jgi:hypothetical protein